VNLIINPSGAPLRYVVSLPPTFTPGTGPWPVLCFLHGYKEATPLPIQQVLTRHGPLRPENPSQAAARFIVVAPQLRAPGGDVWRYQADVVQDIVRWVQTAYNGDPRQTYLTGFSFGGNGVFDLALAQRDMWAALWPVDPTRVPPTPLPRPVWLALGEVSRSRQEAFIRVLRLQSAIDHPDGDSLYLDRGLDHVQTARAAYQDEQVYTWLLTKHL
jgi:hypothetical protein